MHARYALFLAILSVICVPPRRRMAWRPPFLTVLSIEFAILHRNIRHVRPTACVDIIVHHGPRSRHEPATRAALAFIAFHDALALGPVDEPFPRHRGGYAHADVVIPVEV